MSNIDEVISAFLEYISSIDIDFDKIIIYLLGLDSIRSIIASLGIFKRDSKIGKLVYRKYDELLVREALIQLGYSSSQSMSITERLKKSANQEKYPNRDTALHLIYILSKNMIKFNSQISYGQSKPDKKLSYSKYYVNTMGAVHNNKDLNELSNIIIRLMKKKLNDKRPDFIVVPKGGNPLLAQHVAKLLNISLIIAKDTGDYARPQEDDEKDKIYKIWFEGLDTIDMPDKGVKNLTGVIVDCNTSGGTQLIQVASEFNRIITDCDLPIDNIVDCFVLFKLLKFDSNNKEVDTDKAFSDVNCKLHRVLDLDDLDKEAICNLDSKSRFKNYNEAYNSDELHSIQKQIDKKNKLYLKSL